METGSARNMFTTLIANVVKTVEDHTATVDKDNRWEDTMHIVAAARVGSVLQEELRKALAKAVFKTAAVSAKEWVALVYEEMGEPVPDRDGE